MTAHELHHLFFDELKICGCGIPESVGILVRDILSALPPWDHEGELKVLLPTDGLYYFVLGVLVESCGGNSMKVSIDDVLGITIQAETPKEIAIIEKLDGQNLLIGARRLGARHLHLGLPKIDFKTTAINGMDEILSPDLPERDDGVKCGTCGGTKGVHYGSCDGKQKVSSDA